MDELISFGLGLLAFVSAFCLAALARAMRNDKLPPNMWAGIRTKAALESESSWYRVQRAGSVPVICLATAYADSGLRVKMCVWLGVSRGLDLAFLNAD